MENKENILNMISRDYLSMAEAEKKIAAYILGHPADVIYMTVRQLSTRTGVSDGSIIRFANQFGYSGFTQLKIDIAQNLGNKEEIIYDRLSEEDTPKQAVVKTFDNAIFALRQTGDFIIEDDLNKTVQMIMNADKIEFYGTGTSSIVAVDAYYRFMRIGLPAYAVTDAHVCCVSASMLNEKCVAFGISHTGSTIETLQAMKIAKDKGAGTLCLTSFARSPLAQMCDVSLIVASDEVQHSKEAVVSRLVQLALLDAICGYITVKMSQQSIEYIENYVDILGEHREMKGSDNHVDKSL